MTLMAIASKIGPIHRSLRTVFLRVIVMTSVNLVLDVVFKVFVAHFHLFFVFVIPLMYNIHNRVTLVRLQLMIATV